MQIHVSNLNDGGPLDRHCLLTCTDSINRNIICFLMDLSLSLFSESVPSQRRQGPVLSAQIRVTVRACHGATCGHGFTRARPHRTPTARVPAGACGPGPAAVPRQARVPGPRLPPGPPFPTRQASIRIFKFKLRTRPPGLQSPSQVQVTVASGPGVSKS